MLHIVVHEELEEYGGILASRQAQGVGAVLALDPCPHLLGRGAGMTKSLRFCEGRRRGSPLPQFRAHKLLVCSLVQLATAGAEPVLARKADEAESAVRHPCRQRGQSASSFREVYRLTAAKIYPTSFASFAPTTINGEWFRQSRRPQRESQGSCCLTAGRVACARNGHVGKCLPCHGLRWCYIRLGQLGWLRDHGRLRISSSGAGGTRCRASKKRRSAGRLTMMIWAGKSSGTRMMLMLRTSLNRLRSMAVAIILTWAPEGGSQPPRDGWHFLGKYRSGMWAKYSRERDLEEKGTLERGDVGEVGRREDPRRDAEPQ